MHTKIGIIGAGHIGGTLAPLERAWSRHLHREFEGP
jgi:predicted dinucleotide-binding enzyme